MCHVSNVRLAAVGTTARILNQAAVPAAAKRTVREKAKEKSPTVATDDRASTYAMSEGDGNRTRNHRIDSPVL